MTAPCPDEGRDPTLNGLSRQGKADPYVLAQGSEAGLQAKRSAGTTCWSAPLVRVPYHYLVWDAPQLPCWSDGHAPM